MTIYRAARVAGGIRRLRKLKAESSPNEDATLLAYRDLYLRESASFSRFSHLTLLLWLLVLAMGITDALLGVATIKVPSTSATAARMAEAITSFSVGIFVCILLYCCAMFFDALLGCIHI